MRRLFTFAVHFFCISLPLLGHLLRFLCSLFCSVLNNVKGFPIVYHSTDCLCSSVGFCLVPLLISFIILLLEQNFFFNFSISLVSLLKIVHITLLPVVLLFLSLSLSFASIICTHIPVVPPPTIKKFQCNFSVCRVKTEVVNMTVAFILQEIRAGMRCI